MASTIGALIAIVAWLATVTTGFVVLTGISAIAVLAISFGVAIFTQPLIRHFTGGQGPFSPESLARYGFECAMAKKQSVQILASPRMAEVVTRYGLRESDIQLVFDRLLRQGLTPTAALQATRRPEVVAFYFDRIGRSDKTDPVTAAELTILARAES
jgi:hypothetical protein